MEYILYKRLLLFINVCFCFKGVTYDHVELNLYLNGKNMHCPASGIRGTVFPIVYGELYFSNIIYHHTI